MENLDALVANRVQSLRKARGWTLDDLASASGVSRAMISRIERGEASATAVLLAKLAAAFGITLARLFEPEGEPPPIVRRAAETPTRVDPETGYSRRNVTPASRSGADISEIMLPAGARVVFENAVSTPVEQFVWLLAGALEVTGDDVETRLAPGDCRVMSLKSRIVFHNPGDEPARYAVFLAAPRAFSPNRDSP